MDLVSIRKLRQRDRFVETAVSVRNLTHDGYRSRASDSGFAESIQPGIYYLPMLWYTKFRILFLYFGVDLRKLYLGLMNPWYIPFCLHF